MKTQYIISIIQITGWLISYPIFKRFSISVDLKNKEWTNYRFLYSIYVCFIFWWFILIVYIFFKLLDIKQFCKKNVWLNKKSIF